MKDIAKVIVLLFISYCIFCMGMPFPIGENDNFSWIKIFGYYGLLAVVYLIICSLFFVFFHIAQSIGYYIKGYGFSPVLCFPIVIGAGKGGSIRFFLDLFCIADCYYPPQLFSAIEIEEEKLASICYKIQLAGGVCQVASALAVSVLMFFLHKYAFAVSFAILAACYVAVAKIDSSLYQGVIARKKYYVDGEWIFYLARQAILYESDKSGIYCLFEQRMLSCVSENMEKICVETVRHMYMIRSQNNGFLYPDQIKSLVEGKFLPNSLGQFHGMELWDEKFNLLKAYSCCALLNDDEEAIRLAAAKLGHLDHEEKQYSMHAFHAFEWYLQLLQEGKKPKGKNRVLRPNYFFLAFDNYNKIYHVLLKKIDEL